MDGRIKAHGACWIVLAFLFSCIFLIVPDKVIADEPSLPDIPLPNSGGWYIDDNGTSFTMKNGTYPNLTLKSTENVHVQMSACNNYTSINIERNCTANVTFLSLSPLPSETIFYIYQEGNLCETLNSSVNGTLIWTQDISSGHQIWVKSKKSTIYIRSDGTIDPSNAPISKNGNTYSLTADIVDGIIIQKNNLIFDGNDHTITWAGIYMFYTSSGTIKNIVFNSSSLSLFECENIQITTNEFLSSDAIGYIQFVTLSHSNDNVILDNDFNAKEFICYWSECIFTSYSDNNEIISNNFLIDYPMSMTVIDCLWGCNNIVDNNNIGGQGPIDIGIVMAYGSNNYVYNNSVMHCGWSIYIVENNDIIMGNEIKDGGVGIGFIYDASLITNNIIADCGYGMFSYRNDNNIITYNTILSNLYGLFYNYGPGESSSNQFHHNDFIDNDIQIYDNGWGTVSDIWNDGSGHGNYWSDYAGKDDGTSYNGVSRTANDGIGDTALPHQDVDIYPLMKMANIANLGVLLVDMVKDMNLAQGIENSLDSKLHNAIEALEYAKSGKRSDASNKLEAFINEVEAQTGKGLTQAQADELIDFAQMMIDNL